MKLFNAFQIVAAFCAWPYLISWLSDQSFRGSSVAFYSACALYVVSFGAMVFSVFTTLDELD